MLWSWCTGDGPDYMLVQLQEGGVSLTIQHQSGKLATAIRYTVTLELPAQLRESSHKAPDVSHVQAARVRSQVQ